MYRGREQSVPFKILLGVYFLQIRVGFDDRFLEEFPTEQIFLSDDPSMIMERLRRKKHAVKFEKVHCRKIRMATHAPLLMRADHCSLQG